jgi:hypothetical protein
MAKIYYAGDIHGRLNDLGRIIQKAEARSIDAIIQVGDFGFGFPDKGIRKFLEKRARQGRWTVPIYTCLGNHDNWNLAYELREEQGTDIVELVPGSGCYYVHRGAYIEIAGIGHLFLGGAESTDKHKRKEDVNWWANEEPNKDEFDQFFFNLESFKPDTVVTHDAPLRVDIKRMRRNSSTTPNMLENVLKHSDYTPRRWYFGHHHVFERWKIKGTKFFGCGLHGDFWNRES